MKNKKLLFGVCLSLLVGAAALTTASALSATEPQDELLRANIEALTSNEGGSSAEWACWSSLKDGSGPTWLCGSPCEKVESKAPQSGKGICIKNN